MLSWEETFNLGSPLLDGIETSISGKEYSYMQFRLKTLLFIKTPQTKAKNRRNRSGHEDNTSFQGSRNIYFFF